VRNGEPKILREYKKIIKSNCCPQKQTIALNLLSSIIVCMYLIPSIRMVFWQLFFVSSDINKKNINRGKNMILSILKGAICLSGITGLIFAIIVLATGIAPMGEYIPLMAKISAGLFLLAVVIIGNVLNAMYVPSIPGKMVGFGLVNGVGYLSYLTI